MSERENRGDQEAETPGTKIAAENRAEANRASDEDRSFFLAKAMELVYSGVREPARVNRG
jgi:hypothetical protein